MKNSTLAALLIVIISLTIPIGFVTIYFIGSSLSISPQNSSPNSLDNSVNNAAPIAFQFENGSSSVVAILSGSIMHGTIMINVLQAYPIRLYIDDRGFNTTQSVLPAGISFSLDAYGTNYELTAARSVDQVKALPLVPTGLGELAIQYTINVGSNVPTGTYEIRIIIQCFSNGDKSSGYGATYEVALNVQ